MQMIDKVTRIAKRRKLNPNTEQIVQKTKQNVRYQTHPPCTFLDFDILWYLIHGKFINYQQFSLILTICTSMIRYTNYLKFINDVPDSIMFKNSNENSNEKTDPIDVVIQIIKNITPNDILNGNKIISPITRSNIDSNNPTACGTYANSLFYTIISKLEIKFNRNIKTSVLGSFERKSSQLLEIIKLHDKKHTSCIYTLHTNSCDLYKKTVSDGNAQLSNCFQFPGHAIGLIRIAPNVYIFTQTYIKVYDHLQFIKVLNLEGALALCELFICVSKYDVIDQIFIEYWNLITHIDVSCMKGFKFPLRSSDSKLNVFFMEFVY